MLLNQLPETTQSTKSPIGYKPAMMKSDLDKGFDKDEIETLMKYNLPPPSQILQAHINKKLTLMSTIPIRGKNQRGRSTNVIYQQRKKRNKK